MSALRREFHHPTPLNIGTGDPSPNNHAVNLGARCKLPAGDYGVQKGRNLGAANQQLQNCDRSRPSFDRWAILTMWEEQRTDSSRPGRTQPSERWRVIWTGCG